MNDDPEKCLANARGCERMAQRCVDPKERALWIRVAEDWVYLAKAATPERQPVPSEN
jgi:hypothetical protein